MTIPVIALAAILLLWAAVLLAFATPLAARWREPVLRHPVLIIESDDWGAGPLQQADALTRLADRANAVVDNQYQAEARPGSDLGPKETFKAFANLADLLKGKQG